MLVSVTTPVAVSSVHTCHGSVAEKRAKAARDPKIKKMWRRSGKRHARWNHDAIDGTVEEVNTPFTLQPGNKKGGLSNIVEKAMGSIVKSGSAPISGVLSPGDKLKQKGLIYAATPASDFICGTLQLAAGMNMHVFTTGRGTPYGLAEVPVIKVATRSDLARRWHDLMDVNAGTIADGSKTIEEVGMELFELMLDVASGRKKTWAEHWKLHNALVLFNPAPVT